MRETKYYFEGMKYYFEGTKYYFEGMRKYCVGTKCISLERNQFMYCYVPSRAPHTHTHTHTHTHISPFQFPAKQCKS